MADESTIADQGTEEQDTQMDLGEDMDLSNTDEFENAFNEEPSSSKQNDGKPEDKLKNGKESGTDQGSEDSGTGTDSGKDGEKPSGKDKGQEQDSGTDPNNQDQETTDKGKPADDTQNQQGQQEQQQADSPLPDLSEDDVKSILGMKFSQMPGKIKVGENEFDFNEFEETFAEAAAYARVRAAEVADNMINMALERGILADGRKITELTDKIDQLERSLALADKHPDHRKVSNDKAYQDWLKQQPKTVQKAAVSKDPDDVAFAIQSFKDSQNKATPSQAKGKVDALHGGSLRPKNSPPPASKKVEKDPETEFEEAFNA